MSPREWKNDFLLENRHFSHFLSIDEEAFFRENDRQFSVSKPVSPQPQVP